MRKWIDCLKGARRIEWFLAAVAIAILLVQAVDLPSLRETALEQRVAETVRSIDGVGKAKVMIYEDDDGVPYGALIVIGGADDIGVCLRVQRAVHALLGLEGAQIEIAQYAR